MRAMLLLLLCASTVQAQGLVPIDWNARPKLDQILPARGYTLRHENGQSYWYTPSTNPRALTDMEWKSFGYSPSSDGTDTVWKMTDCASGECSHEGMTTGFS